MSECKSPSAEPRTKRRIVMPPARVDPLQKQILAAQAAEARQGAPWRTSVATRLEAEDKLRREVSGSPLGELVTWLAQHTDAPRMAKAVEMLKGGSFQLFGEVGEEAVLGVVRSQVDEGTVYSGYLRADGRYCCANQNLTLCLGLRGHPCKHLMVLLLGLAHAGRLDPARVREWVGRTEALPYEQRAAYDAERLAQTFIKYKAAQAGEVDWRPTQTLPEDFYAL